MMGNIQTPRWVWGVLSVAVFGVSSAGALFQHVDAIPPLLRASWRLQLTSLVLLPFFLFQWHNTDMNLRKSFLSTSAWGYLALSGAALAAHFGIWVASLDQTTLTHSLLFVTAHPLVIVMGMLMLSPFMLRVRKPLRREVIGAVVCFVGVSLTLLDSGSQQGGQTVTVLGDLMAFGGAIFVVGYIVVGRMLRGWMPIFLYAFPVTLIAAILLIPASYLIEEEFSNFGIFGWTSPDYVFWFFLLALIAGIFGHTGLNTCLRYISPLIVSVAVTLEPVIGSIIGWIFFDTGVPGAWTWVGGIVLLCGLITVVVASEHHALQNTNPQNESALSPVE